MGLKQFRTICSRLALVVVVLFFLLFVLVDVVPRQWASILVHGSLAVLILLMALAAFLYARYWQCPYCGQHLGWTRGNICPHCGKPLDT